MTYLRGHQNCFWSFHLCFASFWCHRTEIHILRLPFKNHHSIHSGRLVVARRPSKGPLPSCCYTVARHFSLARSLWLSPSFLPSLALYTISTFGGVRDHASTSHGFAASAAAGLGSWARQAEEKRERERGHLSLYVVRSSSAEGTSERGQGTGVGRDVGTPPVGRGRRTRSGGQARGRLRDREREDARGASAWLGTFALGSGCVWLTPVACHPPHPTPTRRQTGSTKAGRALRSLRERWGRSQDRKTHEGVAIGRGGIMSCQWFCAFCICCSTVKGGFYWHLCDTRIAQLSVGIPHRSTLEAPVCLLELLVENCYQQL